MSRELLKRIQQEAILPEDIDDEIQAYLAQPEPEPVAWLIPGSITRDKQLAEVNGRNAISLYTSQPDQSARIAELIAQRNVHEEIIKTAYARCQELEHQLAALTSDGIRHMETITKLRNQLVTPKWEDNRIAMQVGEIKELKQQLAALQAKLEGGVRVYAECMLDTTGEYYECTRDVEDATQFNATLILDDRVEI